MAQLVRHVIWDHETAGPSPAAPTTVWRRVSGREGRIMFEIKGKVTTAICYAKVVEDEAIEQIRNMCD